MFYCDRVAQSTYGRWRMKLAPVDTVQNQLDLGPASVECKFILLSKRITMEFAELIQVPKLDRVTLVQPFKSALEGSICITGHHLIFSSRKTVGDELWVRNYF